MGSTFEVPIVSIKLKKHPNADTLSIVNVYGWQVVVKTEEWKDGDLAAYIRPDSVVPDIPEYAFLEGHRRIRTRRFRGTWSEGLLVRAPIGSKIGDNVAGLLNIVNYEAPVRYAREKGEATKPLWYKKLVKWFLEITGYRPRGSFPYYDVEHLKRYPEVLNGKAIIVQEKIHGSNICIYVTPRGKLFVRSRTVWRYGDSEYRRAITPELESFVKSKNGFAFYGEIFGPGIQELTYGLEKPTVLLFDVWVPKEARWLSWDEFNKLVPIYLQVPLVGACTFQKAEDFYEEADGFKSFLDEKQIAEGLIIRSTENRCVLKVINPEYLEKVK